MHIYVTHVAIVTMAHLLYAEGEERPEEEEPDEDTEHIRPADPQRARVVELVA